MAIIRYNNPTIEYPGFNVTRPYGDFFTFFRRDSVLSDFDQNPTIKNPSRLNISTARVSPAGPIYAGILDADYINSWNDLEVNLAVYSTPAGVEKYGPDAAANQAGTLNTNKSATRALAGATNQVIRSTLAIGGLPSLTPFSGKLYENIGFKLPTYATTGIDRLNDKYFGVPLPYLDFRARKNVTIGKVLRDAFNNYAAGQAGAFIGGPAGAGFAQANARQILSDENLVSLIDRRYDGGSAALRGSGIAALQAAASTTTGIYTIFNLDTTYGWGQQDDPYAIRNDYTLRSSIAKTAAGANNIYRKALAFTESVLPFRGDRVNAIDFKKRTWQSIYRWAETDFTLGGKAGEKLKSFRKWTDKAAETLGVNPYGNTKDFIKFFFTGPDLYKGGLDKSEDYALVFRAILTSFSDQFSPSWSPVNMVGRADPNYQYGGVSRDIDLGFTVYATDRDELRFIYRKLNYLASFTMPTYNTGSLSIVAPWIRVTVGDLLVSQAAAINSLSYTFVDSDSTWEINFEEDPEMMQVPHKIDVSMGLHLVGNQLPEKLGSLYSLSKQFDRNGVPIGTDAGTNWLYDSETVKRANRTSTVDVETNKLTKQKQPN
jgi:hypothetical protein